MNPVLYRKIEANPVIAAVNNIEKLDMAIHSPCEIVFLLKGSIYNIREMIEKVKEHDMNVYIHIDLIEGFSKDYIALEYIYKNMRPDGIITTKTNLVKAAKNLGICAIQRLFALDSLSLRRGIHSLHQTKPDAIEVLPGTMPKIIKMIHHETKLPVIGGGLIQDKEDVIKSLKAGAIGISTSKKEIWYM